MANLLLILLVSTCLAVGAQADVTGRIAGGSEVWDRCRDPYNAMVALQVKLSDGNDVIICSGVMIAKDMLLTTGHCLFSFLDLNDTVQAVVGQRDMYARDPNEQTIAIESFKVHYDYDQNSPANNIGLIKLARPAQTSKCVQPALPLVHDPQAYGDIDDSCQIMGWGPFYDTATSNSRLLRSAPVTLYGQMPSNVLSLKTTSYMRPFGTLLAEGKSMAQKACMFDIGGMVSCMRNGRHVLRGLIGDSNCNYGGGEALIMVTDVTEYQNWVEGCRENWTNNCPSL